MVGRFVLAFGAGMVSFLSPCVLPLVPGYLSLMSGVGTAQLATPRGPDMRRLLRSTLLFVAGFTLVFTALGLASTLIGQFLLARQRGLNQVAGLLIIVMGLFIAGLIRPAVLLRERRVAVLPDRLGTLAPPLMGMAFAFGWTPCIGPILSIVLATAATRESLGEGVGLLLMYSLGLGVPFVAAGMGIGRLAGVFSWVKAHFGAINTVSGALLVSFGLLLLTNRLGRVSAAIIEVMEAIGLGRLTAI